MRRRGRKGVKDDEKRGEKAGEGLYTWRYHLPVPRVYHRALNDR
jgi:hypothetical protein